MVTAMTKATEDGYEKAIIESSGNTSLGQLAKEDHPYARRHGFPLRDPAYINAQTGAFRNAWKNPAPTVMGHTIEGYIENHDPAADYLTQNRGQIGTRQSYMVERPIDEKVEAFTAESLNIRIAEQLRILETTDIYL